MASDLTRREFMKKSVLTSTGGTLALAAQGTASGAETAATGLENRGSLPKGKIGKMSVSRMLLGGNLLTHYTHSRDLKYVYNLAAHYNTLDKIFETMALAESHGIDAVVIHTAPGVMEFLRKYREELGGKMQWIVCPTAQVDDSMKEYEEQVRSIVEMGTDSVYVWGVRSDALVASGRVDLLAKAVEVARKYGVTAGVGAHDLRVVQECEKNKIDVDFYLKTLHHHKYPSAPRPEQLTKTISEVPGYWCRDPEDVVAFMKSVEKPWIAFKVMAAGAIPPKDAFQYVFDNGADHVVAGMFDFEIEEDAGIMKSVLASAKRERSWWS